jgi:uncharacterized protein YbbC (DUF1343 family)
MRLKVFKNTVLLFVSLAISCANQVKSDIGLSGNKEGLGLNRTTDKNDSSIIVGANQTQAYLPILKGKRIGLVANQTSVIFKNDNNSATKIKEYTHLVDSLLSLNIVIKKVFAPEHGFRGTSDAGEIVKDGIDTKTGLPIISLYGENKKPSEEQLNDLDLLVFDIQDVGARFYTYISTLHYVMEACAEKNIPILILDRPNPNGHYIDGPVLETEHQSFVGMHPVPVVHGMTIGEYAKMINGEGWLKNNIKCDEVRVISVKNYSHTTPYSLPIKPSPNLPNDTAINLYPSLCFFEGTNISVGRGTENQFQIIGSPNLKIEGHDYEFTPQPNEGAKYPKHKGKRCYGYDLTNHKKLNNLNLGWLLLFYDASKANAAEEGFFNSFFTNLAGTESLQQQIENGWSEEDIKKSWEEGLNSYRLIRAKYTIYKDY